MAALIGNLRTFIAKNIKCGFVTFSVCKEANICKKKMLRKHCYDFYHLTFWPEKNFSSFQEDEKMSNFGMFICEGVRSKWEITNGHLFATFYCVVITRGWRRGRKLHLSGFLFSRLLQKSSSWSHCWPCYRIKVVTLFGGFVDIIVGDW